MRDIFAVFIIGFVLTLGFFADGTITGNAVYNAKPDLLAEVVDHGVDTETNEMYVVFYIKNEGSMDIKEGTTIPVRIFVRYTAPPVKREGGAGSISTAEVFLEEAKTAYVLEKELIAGERVLVISPPVPILLSTVRFFEKYNIKNRITVELDYTREIAEADETNNKLVKWYYMQKWQQLQEKVLEP